MGWMSPTELNNDPKRWLDVPHDLHENLISLLEMMFPGFKQKLVDGNVHCLECDGEKPFKVITLDTFETKMVVGYIGIKGKVELLSCHKIEESV